MFFCVILYVVVILSGGAHGAVGLCKNEYRCASPRCREPRRAEPRAHPLGSGRPERRGALRRCRAGVYRHGQALSDLRALPQSARGHPSRRPHRARRRARRAERGRHPRRADGRLHPPERGRVQGLHLPRLHAAERKGSECAAQNRGGGAALRRLSFLRGERKRSAAHHPLALRGGQAPASGDRRRGRRAHA